MKNEIWLIWNEPISEKKYKIGVLKKENNSYEFKYVNPELSIAKSKGFKYFPGFDDLDKTYTSDVLFKNISTRLPNKTRPDYLDILNCYNLEKDTDEFTILKTTKGKTMTDNYEFVPSFDPSKIEFDIAEISNCPDIDECKENLKINKTLYLEPEINSASGEDAIQIIFKNHNQSYKIGYVPRYYCHELLEILHKGIKYSAMLQSINLNSKLNNEKITASVKLIFNI